jgi:hypothetical protein
MSLRLRPAIHGGTLTHPVGEPRCVRRRRYLAGVALAATPLAGCSGDGNGAATVTNQGAVYREAFVDAIDRNDHVVRTLEVETRVALEYTPAAASEEGVRESVNDVARAFFDRVNGGWGVDGLDASVLIEGSLVATWNMERDWIEAYVDGDISRDELGKRVEDSVERHDATETGTGTATGSPTPEYQRSGQWIRRKTHSVRLPSPRSPRSRERRD